MSQLSDYFDAVKQAIRDGIQLTNTLTVEALELEHGNPEKKLPLPLVLIGCGTMEQVEDLDDTDALSFELPMEAHCILPSAECDDVHALVFATRVLGVINKNDYGLEYVNEPSDMEIQPGDFTSVKRGYESRVVLWRQIITLDLSGGDDGLPWIEASGEITLSGNTEPVHTQTIALEQ